VTLLKLFGHDASPYVRRVRIILAELGIPFERDTHGWLDPAPEFEAASPIRRLPVLDRGAGARARYIYDSAVIVETLYSLPHHPRGEVPPLQRTLWNPVLETQDQNVVSVANGALDSLVNVFLLETDGIRLEQSSYLRRQVDRARACLDWLEKVYSGRTTLTEGQLGFCDVVVLSTLGWIRFRERLDLEPWRSLLALEAAHARRPSLESTRPA
jgi:glutathione S-transferase